MGTYESFSTRVAEYGSLRIEHDFATGAVWCRMHAGRDAADAQYRPCFSTRLLKELRQFQLNLPASEGRVLRHLVLASGADVFNLGGDLELFSRLIRAQDRASLLGYARQCVDVASSFHHLADDLHSIALIQGDALGGGFEAALCCQTIVAESGVGMGFPEVLFDLFPGMGAYSFLRRRIAPALAERMMLDGVVYSSDELHRLGIVDVLVPRGDGERAVRDVIARQQRIAHARVAMTQVKAAVDPVSNDELMAVTEIWVDTALKLGDKSLRTMERLVRAQTRRGDRRSANDADIVPLPIAG